MEKLNITAVSAKSTPKTAAAAILKGSKGKNPECNAGKKQVSNIALVPSRPSKRLNFSVDFNRILLHLF